MPDGTHPKDQYEGLQAKSEFCLSNDHIAYVTQHLTAIERAFKDQRFPSLGMNWDQVYPMLYSDGKTVIMVKKSRNVEPSRVLQDIQKEEQAALSQSEPRFAPSYIVGELIVQRGLLDDLSIDDMHRKKLKEDFANDLIEKHGFSEGFVPENVAITSDGPGLFDLLSCNFSRS